MNAQRAVTFLSMCAAGNVQAAFDEYVADDFVHHNAYFPSDRQSLLTAMAESSATDPNKEFNVKHVIEQGDKVAVMSEVVRADDVVRYAVVHTLQFRDEKVVEMWDVGMELPTDSPNELGVF